MVHTHKYRHFINGIKANLSTTFYCTCHRVLDATPMTDNEIRCFCGRLMLLCDYNDIPWDGYLHAGIECPVSADEATYNSHSFKPGMSDRLSGY